MKNLLIIDHWHNAKGGANKRALYDELEKLFDLKFLCVPLPEHIRWINIARSFHPDMNKWKRRKDRIDETMQKTPALFKLTTHLYNQALSKITYPYDTILQIGSLFGPIKSPRKVPYFSYSDSTVRNPDLMLKEWMPPDFDRYRHKWYELETNFFQTITASMFYSRWAADTLVNEYNINPSKAHVVGSAMKITGDHPINRQIRGKKALFVSTDFIRKGGHELIDIFKKVVNAVPDATLTIVGNVPREIVDQNLPWLKTPGPLTKEDLIQEYLTASLFVLPTRYDAFPSVIMEAANFELPSVASDICGIPEMIKDGETGFLVKLDDKDQFATHVAFLLKNKIAAEQMGRAAREYVRSKFTPQHIAKNISDTINNRNSH